jgi:hypothetical protein
MADAPTQAQPLSGGSFPLNTFETAAIELRRPFTAEAVKWKVQTGTLVVPHIDARLAIERLNLVVPHLWSDEYEPIAGGKGLLCRLTVDGITRLDVGSGYEGKGLYSDAFKRACVKFGIAVSLYALPKVFLSLEEGHLTKKKDSKGKEHTYLTDKGRERLDSGYRAWLKDTGEKMFGPALDHGDVAGAIGDPEAEAPAAPVDVPTEAPALDDATAKALVESAEKLYSGLTADQKKGLPKAAFKRTLDGALHSEDHGPLKKLVEDLEGRAK